MTKRTYLQLIIYAYIIMISACATVPLEIVKGDLEVTGKTKLMYEAEEGDVKAIQTLISNGADVNAKNDSYNLMTPLHYASKKNNFKVVKILLENQAKPNVFTDYMDSPLHFAAKNGSNEIVRILIDYGANPDVKQSSKRTPLHYAVGASQNSTAKLLIQEGASFTPIKGQEYDLNITADTALLFAQAAKTTDEAKKYYKIASDYYKKASASYNSTSSISSILVAKFLAYESVVDRMNYMQAKQNAQLLALRDANKFGSGIDGFLAAYQANYKSCYEAASVSSPYLASVAKMKQRNLDTYNLEAALKKKYVDMADNCEKLSEACLDKYNELDSL